VLHRRTAPGRPARTQKARRDGLAKRGEDAQNLKCIQGSNTARSKVLFTFQIENAFSSSTSIKQICLVLWKLTVQTKTHWTLFCLEGYSWSNM
jgi:hypothetical protein